MGRGSGQRRRRLGPSRLTSVFLSLDLRDNLSYGNHGYFDSLHSIMTYLKWNDWAFDISLNIISSFHGLVGYQIPLGENLCI